MPWKLQNKFWLQTSLPMTFQNKKSFQRRRVNSVWYGPQSVPYQKKIGNLKESETFNAFKLTVGSLWKATNLKMEK